MSHVWMSHVTHAKRNKRNMPSAMPDAPPERAKKHEKSDARTLYLLLERASFLPFN